MSSSWPAPRATQVSGSSLTVMGRAVSFLEDDPLAADVDQRVGRAEIDGEILREHLGQRP